ncbi:MAG: hypothetical protein IPN47_27750 [Gemmatimonadetes bacterium]|nr:hypothetical protein [Gemmatimonadota bacterium]
MLDRRLPRLRHLAHRDFLARGKVPGHAQPRLLRLVEHCEEDLALERRVVLDEVGLERRQLTHRGPRLVGRLHVDAVPLCERVDGRRARLEQRLDFRGLDHLPGRDDARREERPGGRRLPNAIDLRHRRVELTDPQDTVGHEGGKHVRRTEVQVRVEVPEAGEEVLPRPVHLAGPRRHAHLVARADPADALPVDEHRLVPPRLGTGAADHGHMGDRDCRAVGRPRDRRPTT